jgi:H/ACA ribonucleoprotein complex subunit 4
VEKVPPWKLERELVTRADVESDPNYGFNPYNRPIGLHMRYGLINLDKPPGPSSHEVVAWVKKILGLQHAGHGGTLEA